MTRKSLGDTRQYSTVLRLPTRTLATTSVLLADPKHANQSQRASIETALPPRGMAPGRRVMQRCVIFLSSGFSLLSQHLTAISHTSFMCETAFPSPTTQLITTYWLPRSGFFLVAALNSPQLSSLLQH